MSTAVKERPILFSAPMVRAILDGRKTQTRRIVKPQPPGSCRYEINGNQDKAYCVFDDAGLPGGIGFCPPTARSKDHLLPCPYGKPGDRLWVRETWQQVTQDVATVKPIDVLRDCKQGVCYAADGERCPITYGQVKLRWRPSIFMRRWASRITLEITGVRVERLQDISEEDAIAEGVQCAGVPSSLTNRGAFAKLWESINGPDSWAANPWVWVVEFHKLEASP